MRKAIKRTISIISVILIISMVLPVYAYGEDTNNSSESVTDQNEVKKKTVFTRASSVLTEGMCYSSYQTELMRLLNEERVKNGLGELETSWFLGIAAQTRAQELSVLFSHTRPDGSPYKTIFDDLGIVWRKTAGENAAYGQQDPQQVFDAWMNSEGHKANILNPDYTHAGFGSYYLNGTFYWIQIFTVLE